MPSWGQNSPELEFNSWPFSTELLIFTGISECLSRLKGRLKVWIVFLSPVRPLETYDLKDLTTLGCFTGIWGLILQSLKSNLLLENSHIPKALSLHLHPSQLTGVRFDTAEHSTLYPHLR